MLVLGRACRSPRELAGILSDHDVPAGEWGRGPARSADKLHGELTAGECALALRDGRVVREVRGATVVVLCADPELGTLMLIEERQVYAAGRVLVRPLDFSVGEKCLTGEAPAAAARRALREELAITEPVSLQPAGSSVMTRSSVGYPGLLSRFDTAHFVAALPVHLVRARYVENQVEKRSEFAWRPRPSMTTALEGCLRAGPDRPALAAAA